MVATKRSVATCFLEPFLDVAGVAETLFVFPFPAMVKMSVRNRKKTKSNYNTAKYSKVGVLPTKKPSEVM